MRHFITLLIVALLCVSTQAQTTATPIETRAHEFGLHAGATTGIGLSYRYWPTRYGVQITMLPIKSPDVKFFSVGVTGLYRFYHSRRICFFGYLANSYMLNDYTREIYDYQTGNYQDDRVYYRGYNVGFGPGFGFGTRVRINIMAGYGFYDIFNEFNIYPTGEIGLYFRF